MRDGVGPTVRTGQPLCCSRLQQMLVQMPGTSVSLTSLVATTLHGSAMALGQRPGNSVAANTPYTCFTLHNVVEWITDRLVCCVELHLQYSLRGYVPAVGKKKIKIECHVVLSRNIVFSICLHCKFEQNATLLTALDGHSVLHWSTLSHLSSSAVLRLCERDKKKESALPFVRRRRCADRLLMSASQATLQMEDTHSAEKARAKHLGVNSPERSPPRKVKWTHYCIQRGRHGLYRAEEINS